MKKDFAVTGMTCSACSAHVEKSVAKVGGVKKVSVNLLTNSMQVDFDSETTNTGAIIAAVEDAGYGASVPDENKNIKVPDENTAVKNMKKRLIVSIIFLVPLLYISMGHMIYDLFSIKMPYFMETYFDGNANALIYSFTQLLLLTPIMLANQNYFKNGFKTLSKKNPNMDSLIAIGAGAAVIYGIFSIYRIGYGLGYNDQALVEQYRLSLYFESAGMILTLITAGKYLEAKAKGKTSEAITKLMKLTPKTVTVIKNDAEYVIDADKIAVGDIFVIKPGESTAVDGIVVEGEASFDESAITGESIPVEKNAGDKLVSASINKTGLIYAKATKVGRDTTLSQIIKLVEEASSSKAPIAALADKTAGIFVPIVITIAVITGIFWFITGASAEFAISAAITVLVISCPCALGLATPVAIMTGTGRGAQNGILIKSGEALQSAHNIDTFVLDKTGTITQGKPKVTDIFCIADITEEALLRIAGSMEKGSEHPLAEAIVNKCSEAAVTLTKVNSFKAHFGKGIEGIVDDQQYYAGNEKMMQEKSVPISTAVHDIINKLSQQGKTALIFASDTGIIGIIAAADVIKPTSRSAIQQLKEYGSVIMLTGDNEVTANAVMEQTGIDEVIANVLPAQKEEKITSLKNSGHTVAMIGDGINDAPALAAADVGIAIGAGTDIAIESADIVLMKNDLLDVVKAVKLSKAVISNIKENLFWAFFYNVIGIPIAAGLLYPIWGIKLNPMFAAAAMSLSSVCVVTNALRLKRVKLNSSSQENDFTPDSNITINKNKGDINMKTIIIKIEGMSCSHCTSRVEKALKNIKGVTDVTVSLDAKNAVVAADDNVSTDVLKDAVVNAGYDVIAIK